MIKSFVYFYVLNFVVLMRMIVLFDFMLVLCFVIYLVKEFYLIRFSSYIFLCFRFFFLVNCNFLVFEVENLFDNREIVLK